MRSFVILSLISSIASAAGVSKAPASNREGTKVELTQDDVADLKVWVDNAKTALGALADQSKFLTVQEKRNLYSREFEKIYSQSGAKANELYVRYIVARALVVDEIVGSTSSVSEIETLVGLFMESTKLALKLYVDDQKYLEALGRGAAPENSLMNMVQFGLNYAESLLTQAKSFMNPQTEYLVTRSALGFLGNDLNSPRNIDRLAFAAQITEIQKALSQNPESAPSDDQTSLKHIRQMKYVYREKMKKILQSGVGESNLGNTDESDKRDDNTRVGFRIGMKVAYCDTSVDSVSPNPFRAYLGIIVGTGTQDRPNQKFTVKKDNGDLVESSSGQLYIGQGYTLLESKERVTIGDTVYWGSQEFNVIGFRRFYESYLGGQTTYFGWQTKVAVETNSGIRYCNVDVNELTFTN